MLVIECSTRRRLSVHNCLCQVTDTVVNAVVKAHMRKVRRAYNTEAFASFVEAATAAEEKGEELPRWNPPSIPLWKGVYHLHRFVNERMAEREFADAIARGWRDAGFTKKADGQYMSIPQSCKVRPLTDRRKLASHQEDGKLGALFDVVGPDLGKSLLASKLVVPMELDSRGALSVRRPRACVGNWDQARSIVAQDDDDDGDMDGDQRVDDSSDDEVSAAVLMRYAVHRTAV